MFLLFMFLLNLCISALNAWGCGKSWNETRYQGGFAHFMNWMGAIMAACGFTWCNLVILALIGSNVPVEQDDGTTAMLLDPESAQAFFELGYLVIIGPVIGSGIAITVHSWGVWWRNRTFGNTAIAGFNTAADIYNIYHAAQALPGITQHLSGFFRSRDNDGKGILVLLLVALAVFGGVLTTYTIITMTAESTADHRSRASRARRVRA